MLLKSGHRRYNETRMEKFSLFTTGSRRLTDTPMPSTSVLYLPVFGLLFDLHG